MCDSTALNLTKNKPFKLLEFRSFSKFAQNLYLGNWYLLTVFGQKLVFYLDALNGHELPCLPPGENKSILNTSSFEIAVAQGLINPIIRLF